MLCRLRARGNQMAASRELDHTDATTRDGSYSSFCRSQRPGGWNVRGTRKANNRVGDRSGARGHVVDMSDVGGSVALERGRGQDASL